MTITFMTSRLLLVFYSITLITMAFSSVNGQNANQEYLTKVIKPSPDAASLGRYGEYPVSYNTGTPQISIPIHEVSSHDIKVPISLSYHAGGHRVEEIASWVGLGWSLDAGGVITRTMVGLPDESQLGFFNTAQWAKWDFWEFKVPMGIPTKTGTDSASLRHYFWWKIADGSYDLMPDVYSFNFLGYSGTMVFTKDRKVVVIPYQDFKIVSPFDPQHGVAGQWTITTPDGIVCVFADAELTTPLNVSGTGLPGAPAYHSAWYLSQIYSLKSTGAVNFHYSNMLLAGADESPNSGMILAKTGPPVNDCSDPPYAVGNSVNEYTISTKILQRITHSEEEVFFATSERMDRYRSVSYNGKKLDYIQIAALNGNLNPDTIKTVKLKYVYTGEGKRLTLETIRDRDKVYSFEYNTEFVLPTVESMARDHWGFYNGANANSSLIPGLTRSEEELYHLPPGPPANREASQHTTASLLTKIIYPTKGYTKFEYEPHTYYTSLTAKNIFQSSAQGATTNPSMTVAEQALLDWYLQQQIPYADGPINITSTTFSIPEAKYVDVFFSRTHLSGSTAIPSIADGLIYKLPIVNSYAYWSQPEVMNLSTWKSLQAGQYIIFTVASPTDVTVQMKVEEEYTYLGNKTVGGARIRRITNNDGISSQIKIFDYSLPDGKSSSTLFSGDPVYRKATPCGKLYVSAYNLLDYSPKGGHIGYSQVKVTEVEKDENDEEVARQGYILYKYMNGGHETQRSLLTDEIHFRQNGDTVQHAQTQYSAVDMNSIYVRGVKVKIIFHHFLQSWFEGLGAVVTFRDDYEFSSSETQYSTAFYYPKVTLKKTFSMDSYPNYLLTRTDQEVGKSSSSYRSRHLLPTLVTTTDSRGNSFVEKTVYSTDIVGGVPGIDSLIKVPVLKHSLYKKNGSLNLQRSVKTTYQNNVPSAVYEFTPAGLYPFSLSSDASGIAYKERVRFNYTPERLLKEQYKANDVRTTYLWDSRGVNPIAEVVNAEYTDVAFTSFENGGNEGNWIFNSSAIVKPTTYRPRTGAKHYKFNGTALIKSGLSTSRTYRLTFWSQQTQVTVNGATISNVNGIVKNGWYFFDHVLTAVNSVSLTGSNNTTLDELRLYPDESLMTTYVYERGVGLVQKMDPNSRAEHYEYDTSQRLYLIKDDDENVVKRFEYQYKTNSPGSTPLEY